MTVAPSRTYRRPQARPPKRIQRERNSRCSCWARSAWCSAISAPARSMPFAKPCMRRPAARRSVRDDVLGVLSLIVWALTLIVTVKYVAFVLRADNRGEGGTLSLMALARASYPQRAGADPRHRHLRRRAVLRRRHHHAGDLGAVGRRGPRSGDADPRCLCRADHAGHPGGAVFGAALGNRRASPRCSGRSRRCWFLAIAAAGVGAYRRRLVGALRAQPVLCDRLSGFGVGTWPS